MRHSAVTFVMNDVSQAAESSEVSRRISIRASRATLTTLTGSTSMTRQPQGATWITLDRFGCCTLTGGQQGGYGFKRSTGGRRSAELNALDETTSTEKSR